MKNYGTDDCIVSEQGRKYRLLEQARYKENKKLYLAAAREEETSRKCFLKFIREEDADEASLLNLKREGGFRFHYPFIEHVYDSFSGRDGDGNGICGVSLEYIEGCTLRQFYSRQKEGLERGDVTEEAFERQIFRQILQFLSALHYYLNFAMERFLHRDLRPENVMINENGDAVIIDFDFAHLSGSRDTTYLMQHSMIGLGFTFGYTDPRTLRNLKTDAMSDIYSAGRLLFFWLNGEDYFSRAREADRNYCRDPEIGYGLETQRFREKYRDDRYRKLRTILKKMCGDPGKGERYTETSQILKDMKNFLMEYYKGSYEKVLQLDRMPLLYRRRCRIFEKAPYVTKRVLLPGEPEDGHGLYQYTMRDIRVDNTLVMVIYNLGGTVYYIPMGSVSRENEEYENEDYVVHSGDIFTVMDRIRIQFTIE